MATTSDIRSLFPNIYDGVREADVLADIENGTMDILYEEIERGLYNTFVLHADILGIEAFEEMLNIQASPETEDVEFRRARILNRLSTKAPLTYRWLVGRLESILGVGTFELNIDYANRIMTLESSQINQNWYEEILVVIYTVKPANLVFINTPYVAQGIIVGEQVVKGDLYWNYKLDGSWLLGQKPFLTADDYEVIKVPTTASLTQALLADTAEFIAEDVSYALLNGSVEITDISTTSVGNTANISYTVSPSDGVSEVTRIQLMRADGVALTDTTVYIPIVADASIQHTFPVQDQGAI